ncbi:SpaA isopeptide-forming pilin-related protein [Microbacterium sp. EST19A]|uniref:prealbumin-like fold domain-containing protein n=1 Tax=Microbacterium sp. EST19A TaxID=2862681 RepID=UPI001CC08D58
MTALSRATETNPCSAAAAGVILLDGLSAGEYTLTEAAAPSGYSLLDQGIAFTVSPERTDIDLGSIENSRIPSGTGAREGGDDDPGALAHTGGDSVLPLLIGAILIVLGLASLAIQARRSRA